MTQEQLVEFAKRLKAHFESQRGLWLKHSLSVKTGTSPNLGHITQKELARIVGEDQNDKVLDELVNNGIVRIESDFKAGASVLIYPGFRLEEFVSKDPQPKKVYEGFDAERGMLRFAGKDILLSKKIGKENNPVRLIATLSKDRDRWWYFDEVLEDWEGANWEQRKERVAEHIFYDAATTVNAEVAKQTSVPDFLEFTTTKFRINPAYLTS